MSMNATLMFEIICHHHHSCISLFIAQVRSAASWVCPADRLDPNWVSFVIFCFLSFANVVSSCVFTHLVDIFFVVLYYLKRDQMHPLKVLKNTKLMDQSIYFSIQAWCNCVLEIETRSVSSLLINSLDLALSWLPLFQAGVPDFLTPHTITRAFVDLVGLLAALPSDDCTLVKTIVFWNRYLWVLVPYSFRFISRFIKVPVL